MPKISVLPAGAAADGTEKIAAVQTGQTVELLLSALPISTATQTALTAIQTTLTATQTALNLKAALASPTFTGVPVAPTASAWANSTQIATTAYADAVAIAEAPGTASADSRATAASTSFRSSINIITTGGYASPGDRGEAKYIKASGTTAGGFQSADGQWWKLAPMEFLTPQMFGAKGDGSTDDTTALQAAITAAAGSGLVIQGICGVSSTLTLPSNITLTGVNNKIDGFLVLGSNSVGNGILDAENKRNVAIRNLGFYGNLIEPAPFSTGAILIELSDTAVTDSVNFEISHCSFTGFRTNQWIWLVSHAQLGNTLQMREIKIFNNEVIAAVGSATTFAISANQGNSFVRVSGNTLILPGTGSVQGSISSVVFANNTCLGFGLSGMINVFSNVYDIAVVGNVTRNMGNNTLVADTAYTYLFYNTNTAACIDPTNIVVSGNAGYGNHNNAVYCAGAVNVVITGNFFGSTFPSGIEPTLPHGAHIALSSVINGTVSGNTLVDGLGGVALIFLADRASSVTIANNSIKSVTNRSATQAAYGILLSGTPSGASTNNVTLIDGNNILLTGTGSIGIIVTSGSGLECGVLDISNNAVSALVEGIATNTLTANTTLKLSGNRWTGAFSSYGINITASGLVSLTNETVDARLMVAGGATAVALSGTKYTINGLTIAGQTSGSNAFTASGVQGSMRNVSFPGCTLGTLVVAGSIGLAKPTWTGSLFDTVQCLSSLFYTETGTTPKYTTDSWVYSTGTTWLDRRQPTGN